MHEIRRALANELPLMLGVINVAAEKYKGVIPADRWHEPYMSRAELEKEVAAGVEFWVYLLMGDLIGLMGTQAVKDVDLIRHAYVKPGSQGLGVGGALIEHIRSLRTRRMLVGTWAAAEWAVRFYEKHGFELVAKERTPDLLRTYWNIPERQIETSVVLANPPIDA